MTKGPTRHRGRCPQQKKWRRPRHLSSLKPVLAAITVSECEKKWITKDLASWCVSSNDEFWIFNWLFLCLQCHGTSSTPYTMEGECHRYKSSLGISYWMVGVLAKIGHWQNTIGLKSSTEAVQSEISPTVIAHVKEFDVSNPAFATVLVVK